jgi:hypothetical protein
MTLQQKNVFVNLPVQSQLAHQFVHGADSTETDRPGFIGDLILDVGIFEHEIGLVLVLLSYEPGIKILLVTEDDFVVSFIHLECAPFGCSGYFNVPIITNSDAHFRVIIKFSLKITLV